LHRPLKILVILPNHELPPRNDSPGISYLVHNQISNSIHKITTLSIKSTEKKELKESNYCGYIIPRSLLIIFKNIFSILGPKLRFKILGVEGLEKFTRIFLTNIFHLIVGGKYDVIVYHNYFESIKFGGIVSRIWKNKIVYYFHGSGLLNYGNLEIRLKYLNKLDGLITISGENIENLKAPSVNIINNYVPKFKSSTNKFPVSKILFCSTSNIDENKNIHHAISLLMASNFSFEWEFHIFGKILDLTYFNNTLKPFLSNNKIKFFGEIEHDILIQKLSDYSFVFQLSRLREGNSMSLIEAMVEANVVGIGSSIGGIPIVLDNGNFGLLINLEQPIIEQSNLFKSFVIEELETSVCRNKIFQNATEYFSPLKSATLFDNFIQLVDLKK
jgi:glycosyltransferase involved in cell wall biosynthesis